MAQRQTHGEDVDQQRHCLRVHALGLSCQWLYLLLQSKECSEA